MLVPLANGIWAYLPLGYQVIRQLKALVRAEMDAARAEELRLPVIHPAEIWEAAGRLDSLSKILLRLKAHEGRRLILGAAQEEAIIDLCLREIESYKDLPRTVYQFQSVVQEPPENGEGFLRLYESLYHSAYSLHADADSLDQYYKQCHQAYLNIFEQCDLEVVTAQDEADQTTHAFMLPLPDGTDSLVRCDKCDYAASLEAATFTRREAQFDDPLPLEKVETPDCKTIADLCNFLNIEPAQTLKLVIYTINVLRPNQAIVMALVRGDLDVSETKLMKLLGVNELKPSTEDEISEIGAAAGYASPIGVPIRKAGSTQGVYVIADESLTKMSNFVTGANDPGYHIINANYPRDFKVTQIANIAEPYNGAGCPQCEGALQIEPAVTLGYCRKWGTCFSEPTGAAYLDDKGKEQPLVLGSYGLSLDRIVAAMIETHHDDYGILWPGAVSPYDVHLVALVKDEAAAQAAETLYANLQAAQIDTLYDDRGLSPGVMFSDADLMGIPLRLTISKRSLENGGIEVKWRHEKDRFIIPLEDAINEVKKLLGKA